MDIKSLVQSEFNTAVDQSPYNSEMKLAVKEHPRMKDFVQNLYRELMAVQVLRVQKGKGLLKRKTIQDTVRDMTTIFLKGFHDMAEKRAMSDLKKLAEEAKAQKQKDLEATADGKPQGDYEELVDMGLKIGETREENA